MARLRISSDDSTKMMLLCIMLKPACPNPEQNSISKARPKVPLKAKATTPMHESNEPVTKSHSLLSFLRLSWTAAKPTIAPPPLAAPNHPMASGPRPNTSRAKTGSRFMYGKAQTFIKIVTRKTPNIGAEARILAQPCRPAHPAAHAPAPGALESVLRPANKNNATMPSPTNTNSAPKLPYAAVT